MKFATCCILFITIKIMTHVKKRKRDSVQSIYDDINNTSCWHIDTEHIDYMEQQCIYYFETYSYLLSLPSFRYEFHQLLKVHNNIIFDFNIGVYEGVWRTKLKNKLQMLMILPSVLLDIILDYMSRTVQLKCSVNEFKNFTNYVELWYHLDINFTDDIQYEYRYMQMCRPYYYSYDYEYDNIHHTLMCNPNLTKTHSNKQINIIILVLFLIRYNMMIIMDSIFKKK